MIQCNTNTIKGVNLIPLWSIESENKTKTNLWSGTSQAPLQGGRLMRSTRLWNYVPSESGKWSYWCMTLKWGDAKFTWSTIMRHWKEGLGERGRDVGEKKKKSLQVGNLKTHKPQHPPRLEKEISNTAFNNSEDIKRTLVFVGKSEEAGLFIDMKWIFGGCCYGLSDVCLYSIFPLRWKIVARWFLVLAALHDSIIKDSSRGHLSNLWKKYAKTKQMKRKEQDRLVQGKIDMAACASVWKLQHLNTAE